MGRLGVLTKISYNDIESWNFSGMQKRGKL